MAEVDVFLQEAAAIAGVDTERLLARVLHIDDGALESFATTMEPQVKALVERLDRELRLRNPGLHYVERKMFLGYRREGATSSPLGERSQIFASLIRNNTRLEVVLPVDAGTIGNMPNARDLRGTGHHGIGDVRVLLTSTADIERFLADFHYWLTSPVSLPS